MNIHYDYQILFNQKYGGISRYYYELINTIERLHLAKTSIQCKYSINYYFSGYDGVEDGRDFMKIKSPLVRRPLRLWGHLINQAITRKNAKKADIVHLTYYRPYALNICNIKKILTVYDMIEELVIKDPKLDWHVKNKKRCIYESDHIIAISENTKRDILRLYPDIDENKITVIYIGTSMKSQEKLGDVGFEHNEKNITFPNRYILFVGQRGGYKNFDGFMKAAKQILLNDKELSLLCIGGGTFSEEEISLLKDVKEQVYQMNVDDEILAKAYSEAECFVFPSLYEGFGIPTLEAFTCGCPAVISNTSSMPEVGGDAVLYFDPKNIDEMRSQIEKILNDKELRQQLIEKGKERVKLFLWEDIARQTVDCYKKVLNE